MIVGWGNVAQYQMNIPADGKIFGSNPAEAPPHGNRMDDGSQIGAQQTGINQLSTCKAFKVRATGSRQLSLHDGNDIGGGAANIDQQTIGELAGKPGGGSHPISSGKIERVSLSCAQQLETTIEV